MERSGYGVTEAQYRNLRETTKILSQDSLCPGRVRTEHRTNISPDRYQHTSLLGIGNRRNILPCWRNSTIGHYLSQMNLLYVLPSCLFKIYFNIISSL
jgi:hypothetical protein